MNHMGEISVQTSVSMFLSGFVHKKYDYISNPGEHIMTRQRNNNGQLKSHCNSGNIDWLCFLPCILRLTKLKWGTLLQRGQKQKVYDSNDHQLALVYFLLLPIQQGFSLCHAEYNLRNAAAKLPYYGQSQLLLV